MGNGFTYLVFKSKCTSITTSSFTSHTAHIWVERRIIQPHNQPKLSLKYLTSYHEFNYQQKIAMEESFLLPSNKPCVAYSSDGIQSWMDWVQMPVTVMLPTLASTKKKSGSSQLFI
jgi:hypothetical protein